MLLSFSTEEKLTGDPCRFENLRVLFVHNLNNVAPWLSRRLTHRLGELGIEPSVLPSVSLNRRLMKFFEVILSRSWSHLTFWFSGLCSFIGSVVNAFVHKT